MIASRKLTVEALHLIEQHVGRAPITTGIPRLDDFIFGWLPSTLCVIEGDLDRRQPSQLVQQLAVFHALEGGPVAHFSLQTTVRSTIEQMLEVVAGGSVLELDPTKAQPGREVARIGLRDRFEEAMARVSDAPLFLNDRYDLTPVSIIEECRTLLESHGRCTAFVDSIHGVLPADPEAAPLNELESLRILALGARRFQIPVVVTARTGALDLQECEEIDVLIRLTIEAVEDAAGLDGEREDPWGAPSGTPWPHEAIFDIVRNDIGSCGTFSVPYEPVCHRYDHARE